LNRDRRRDSPILFPNGQRGSVRAQRINRACRQALGDDQRNVVAAAGMARQHGAGIGCQLPAEIGPHQILRPIPYRAGDRDHRQAQRREIGAQPLPIEPRMHGIAARAWASRSSSIGPVASDAPLRCNPMRAAVSRRRPTQASSSAEPGAGCGATAIVVG
jgi:hypothetical protein